MGPPATTLTGPDILHATTNIHDETAYAKFFPAETPTRTVSAGDLGRKAGRGFYTYE
jgi:3-hydroxybutyryl-CoA dehydrogenase